MAAEFRARAAGYQAAWNALPASIRSLTVIRDTPRMLDGGRTLDCVTRALTRHQPAGTTCARPRALALQRDPAALAATRIRSRHVEVIDLTRYFCDRQRCFPVIGGVLVYKDISHITAIFSTSLGPIIARQLAH